MVVAQRDLSLTLGHTATKEELFKFLQVEPDGLTREHVHYLTAMYQHFAQITDDEQVGCVADKAAIRSLLRQTKPGIRKIESFLLERRLIDRTRGSRRLSVDGVVRAAELRAQGKDAG
jgi:Holliday junction resolvasome RuvABC ATP-dependent DNA helicase subunit